VKKFRTGFTTRRLIGTTALVAIGLVAGNVASSFADSKNQIISSCVNRKSGDMRYLSKGSCKRTELMISWNVQGLSGPSGIEGQQGLQGPRGPAGENGPIGPNGLSGPTGPAGLTGALGPMGLAGADGQPGPAGAVGPMGPQGADGASQTVLSNSLRSGTGIPSSSLGVDGDFYIDTSSTKIHGPKSGGSWPVGVSIVGPVGAAGLNGEDGLNGTNGTNGAPGANGTNGLNGTNGANGAPGTVLLGSSFYVVSHYQMNGTHSALCRTGDVATGGGIGGYAAANYPVTNASDVPIGWRGDEDFVYAVCLDLP